MSNVVSANNPIENEMSDQRFHEKRDVCVIVNWQ